MSFHKRGRITLAEFSKRLPAYEQRPSSISPARWYAMLRQYDKWRLERDQMTMEELIGEWESEED